MLNIIKKLNKIEQELTSIKEHMKDSRITEEDYEAILAYKKEKKANKLISHEEVRKELRG